MSYDLIVIGAGPGGYVCAERAGQAGLKALLIEKEELGGVCLNWGCIPTKTLLACAKVYYQAAHGESFGVGGEITFSLEQAMARKADVQKKLRAGVASLMKMNKVEVVRGDATIVGQGAVEVDGQRYEGKNLIIATGSRPMQPPIPGADLPHVLDSTALLDIDKLPQDIVIIGGGVIGIEFACFFAQVDVKVTVVEMLPSIGGPIDPDLAKVLEGELKSKGVVIHTGAKVTSISEAGVSFTDTKGAEQTASADTVLMATGRVPNVEGIGLEEAGIETGRKGIVVDELCRTNVPNTYAIGDVNGKIQLAHVASRQAEVVVNHIVGKADHMRYAAVPGVIYTSPEVAFCGLSEAQAKAKGIPVKVAKWPLLANGRFIAENDGKGLAKVVVDAETRAVLGIHLIGGACSEMIAAAALCIENELRVDELKETIFPHPTASEAQRDALFHL